MTTASSGESALGDLIRDEIATTGPMPFAGFMARALYHPTLGYYAGGGRGREPLGWEGDYVTSGDLHPLWGWSLARQLHQMWELLGHPVVFDVLEAGAGRGLLAAAVWRYARELAPGWLPALRYTLVDSAPLDSPLRRTREQGLASALAALDVPVHATRWASTIGDVFATSSLVGAVVSNELVDALPVHVVEVAGGELREVYVAADAAGRLIEQLGPPSTAELVEYLIASACRGAPMTTVGGARSASPRRCGCARSPRRSSVASSSPSTTVTPRAASTVPNGGTVRWPSTRAIATASSRWRIPGAGPHRSRQLLGARHRRTREWPAPRRFHDAGRVSHPPRHPRRG